ncbi:RNA chaperone Hfq [Vibrio splendidus]|nr:RNA chaperone Hfq [Vibrio splendidus]MCC4880432.1 RNA chaperone Hfq [Vibrio splendidus]
MMIKSEIYNKIATFLCEKGVDHNIEVFLQNGIRMSGAVASHDEYALELVHNNQSSIINTDVINTIVVTDTKAIEEFIRNMESFKSKPVSNNRIQENVCLMADKTQCEVEMFFLNRINLSGHLLRYDRDIMMIFSKVNRQGKWVSMLQFVNIDNIVSCTLKVPHLR